MLLFFFELGGDSIKAMLVIIECRLTDLCVQNIYEGRTPKRIEKLIKTRVQKDVSLSDTAVHSVHVNASQDYLLRVQSKNPESSVLNLPVRFVFDHSVNLNRMAYAIEKAILLHPSLYSTIEETKDGFIQRFDKSITVKIVPEKMSKSELELIASGFVKPFHFDHTPMFRCRLVLSKIHASNYAYLLTKTYFNHIIFSTEPDTPLIMMRTTSGHFFMKYNMAVTLKNIVISGIKKRG